MTAPRAPANRVDIAMVIAGEIADGRGAGADGIPRVGRNTLKRAFSVLAALEAAGVRLVPAEATRRMINDGIDALNAGTDAFVGADDAYQAVLAASPYAPEGGR